jgi:hypothetical protein
MTDPVENNLGDRALARLRFCPGLVINRLRQAGQCPIPIGARGGTIGLPRWFRAIIAGIRKLLFDRLANGRNFFGIQGYVAVLWLWIIEQRGSVKRSGVG